MTIFANPVSGPSTPRTTKTGAPPTPPTPTKAPVKLGSGGLTIDELVRVASHNEALDVQPDVQAAVTLARNVVERALNRKQRAYGLNTHLGHRRNDAVDNDDLDRYQHYVVDTHIAAIGEPLDTTDVRALLTARIAGMARGGAGVSVPVFNTLVSMLNRGVHPVVPGTGSVGASDLTLFAAIADVVRGEGTAELKGVELSGGDALRKAGLNIPTLRPKDALSIVSSNSASIGIGAIEVLRVEQLADAAEVAASLTIEATHAELGPFAGAVARNKAFAGQAESARLIRTLVAGRAKRNAPNVQDALSIRTVPQVHGALRDQLRQTRLAVEAELNSKADNPVVSIEHDALISNGNFSPMTMTLAFEGLRLAMAHVGAISERRLHKLLAVRRSTTNNNEDQLRANGRIPNLVVNAAASLLADLRHTALPISLNSTSLNCEVEDHSSLALNAVMLTRRASDSLEQILAIEAALAADTLEMTEGLERLAPLSHDVVEQILTPLSSRPAREFVAQAVDVLKAIEL